MRIGYGRIAHGEDQVEQRDRLTSARCDTIVFDKPGETTVLDWVISQLSASFGRPELVVCSLDRLAKNLTQLFDLIVDLSKAGIHLISLEEEWNLSPTSGHETLRTIHDLIRFRQKIATEKSSLGLRAAASKERQTGRPRAINATRLAKVAQQLSDGDRTVAELARELKVSPATLYRHLADLKTTRNS